MFCEQVHSPEQARRVVALLDLGYSEVSADVSISEKVWSREDKINYASTPGFLIRARK